MVGRTVLIVAHPFHCGEKEKKVEKPPRATLTARTQPRVRKQTLPD
jgi:hypothetical protein